MAKNNAYPREFRERAVELSRSGGVSMEALAKQLGVASTTIANWIRQARVDDGEQPGISTADRDELTQLRRVPVTGYRPTSGFSRMAKQPMGRVMDGPSERASVNSLHCDAAH